MFDRVKLVLVAALFAFSLVFAASVGADEPKKGEGCAGCPSAGKCAGEKAGPTCDYLMAVKHVVMAIRCNACAKAEKPCGKCVATARKIAAAAAIKTCKGNGECKDCPPLPTDAHCQFCAEKQIVADHVLCPDCRKEKKDLPPGAGEGTSRAERGDVMVGNDCPKCKELRDAVVAVKCPTCGGAAH